MNTSLVRQDVVDSKFNYYYQATFLHLKNLLFYFLQIFLFFAMCLAAVKAGVTRYGFGTFTSN